MTGTLTTCVSDPQYCSGLFCCLTRWAHVAGGPFNMSARSVCSRALGCGPVLVWARRRGTSDEPTLCEYLDERAFMCLKYEVCLLWNASISVCVCVCQWLFYLGSSTTPICFLSVAILPRGHAYHYSIWTVVSLACWWNSHWQCLSWNIRTNAWFVVLGKGLCMWWCAVSIATLLFLLLSLYSEFDRLGLNFTGGQINMSSFGL
jgi:hypothetical protein